MIGVLLNLSKIINNIWSYLCTPVGIFGLIPIIIGVATYVAVKKRNKIDYDKPNINILESFATPPPFKSKIKLEITNPSNFVNSITCFELKSNNNFSPCCINAMQEINIKLPKTEKYVTEITLDFEAVKNLRGKNAILILKDIKGSKIKKKFKFMKSYNLPNT
jgi:hypothetical protein